MYIYFSHKYIVMKVIANHCKKSDLFELTQCWTKLLLTTEPFTVLKLIISITVMKVTCLDILNVRIIRNKVNGCG